MNIFVFGSNLAGIHGAGAALHARHFYGAVLGVGVGPQGRAYALPTKDQHFRVLPLFVIAQHVTEFISYAKMHPELTFNVTAVGCGYAGYNPFDIAPLFKGAPPNCELPNWWRCHC